MSIYGKMKRLGLVLVLGLSLGLGLGAAGFGMALAWPGFAFPHHMQVGQIRLRMAKPVPEAAREFLARIDLSSQVAGVPDWSGPLEIYIAQGGWRQAVFIDLLARGAGGVTYTPVAPRHFFLSGADFAADTLVRNEFRITRPRSLTYYVKHETNHLVMARMLGRIGLHQRPQWVMEGIADLAGLGRPDRSRMLRWMGNTPTQLRDRVAFGAYPRERLLADWALYHRGMEFLLSTDLTEAEAWALMTADGWGGQE